MYEYTVKVVLCDIEGTTTSISFVKDIMFTYAKQHTKEYLEETWLEPTTTQIVLDLLDLPEFADFREAEAVAYRNESYDLETVNAFVIYLIDKDLKLGPLKTLQGFVWEKGFQMGALKGHVFPDVPVAFKTWHDAGLLLAIYSSGSIKAQTLLFSQTELGNLLPFISKHFDTTVGHKQEIQSYLNIALDLGTDPEDILFLTDINKEAEAAHAAGCQVVILARPGNAPLTDDDKSQFPFVYDFSSLKIKPR